MSYAEMLKRAQEDGSLRSLAPRYVEFKKKGMEVVGKLVGIIPISSKVNDGSYNQYLMQTDDGLIKFQMGGATDADVSCSMMLGSVYHIEFRGQEPLQGGKTINNFVVSELMDASFSPVGGNADQVE